MNTMLVMLVGALIATISCAPQEKYLEIKNKCMQESGATSQMVDDAHKGKFSSDAALTNFFSCVGKSSGIMDDKGHVNKDVLKKSLTMFSDNEAVINAAIEKCVVEKATPEETAIESTKCVFMELNK